ncbi:hypothetical protein L198_03609 [Cryptococcus wingfieldii CBS 7118]|uniref:Uncharacterized protein n=1 Tax=Cryptococcus wingfieldii CBS 7118 TaxID=1295528 RepID=A0A1E3JCF4_9TREE|nr:hypothetical protein L198_03609 [Cryptococcus wingfieldii CBS 7118]ODN98365.1 hypothetical protein L198_03609 [Cryptococcus wingfieldii CBS 7118]
MEDPASSPSSSTFQLDSPSASTLLRTADTLEGLAKQLENLKDDSDASGGDGEVLRCCCGAAVGDEGSECRMMKDKQRTEDKLKMSGELGTALLQRYEVLEKKNRKEGERHQQLIEVKRTALAASVKRVHNLEKANTTHMQKYAEMSRKMEVVEKRYAEAMHTQTLTQQSLTHVRSELTNLRDTNARQTVALASRGGVEERLLDAEKRFEEARDLAAEETRKLRDERRKVQRAESRIAELETQLRMATKEADAVREARAHDAQDLLANAKKRLETLHAELSEVNNGESPEHLPEHQRILEELVANNTLLKHDAAELSHSLVESRDEVRTLRDEIESLRASIGSSRLASPIDQYPRLAHELSPRFSHSRTESTPIPGWNQSRLSPWEHSRKLSTGIAGLGMGPIGEAEGSVASGDVRSTPVSPVVESPQQETRPSPGGGIGYMVNGVLKHRPASARFSGDSRVMRNYASRTIGSIDETISQDEPQSPGSDYFRAADISRKRRSLRLSRQFTPSPNDISDYSPNASTMVDQSTSVDLPSPVSESAVPERKFESPKQASRRTLLLLTKSRGVQTDPIPEEKVTSERGRTQKITTASSSRDTSATGGSSAFATPNPEDGPASSLLVVVEHMSRILAKLRAADVPTLNKRLKKANLSGDVMHLSQTTLRSLQQEISEVRHHFRGIHNFGMIDPRDFNLLLRLMKDVFNDLVELQAVVNDVTITPAVAKKLQRAAYRAEEDEAAKASNVSSGLGWIAAPITKFFVTPADAEGDAANDTSPGLAAVAGLDRGKSMTMPRKAVPKQQAMASATATHVSVNFGGTGMVRKIAPAVGLSGPGGEALSSPVPPVDQRAVSGPATLGRSNGGLAPPQTIRTLRSVKSKANRNDLLGIFAGAAPRSSTPEPWTVVKPPDAGSRAARGRQYEEKTVRPFAMDRKKLSSAVDAVIDQSAIEEDDDVAIAGSYEPPLLERQLRPRGLSDSSIRSTTVSLARDFTHHIPAAAPAPNRAAAYGTTPSTSGSVFQTLSKKFYSFRAPETLSPEPEDSSQLGSTPPQPPLITKQIPSPARPIPRSPSRASSVSTTTSSTRGDRSSRQTGASPVTASSSQTRFFGYIANSLAPGSEALEQGMEGEQEFVGGNFRQGAMLGHARLDSGKQRNI